MCERRLFVSFARRSCLVLDYQSFAEWLRPGRGNSVISCGGSLGRGFLDWVLFWNRRVQLRVWANVVLQRMLRSSNGGTRINETEKVVQVPSGPRHRHGASRRGSIVSRLATIVRTRPSIRARRMGAGLISLGAGLGVAVLTHFVTSGVSGIFVGLLCVAGAIPAELSELVGLALVSVSLISGLGLGVWVGFSVHRRSITRGARRRTPGRSARKQPWRRRGSGFAQAGR